MEKFCLVVSLKLLGLARRMLVRKYLTSLVDEDNAVISRGARMQTKRELQELEGHINYASFVLAGGGGNSKAIDDWISEARKTAFCLSDQIAMYEIRVSSKSQLYRMKYAIGMQRIGELTRRMEGHKAGTLADLQRSPQSLPQLSELSPFIYHARSVPAKEIIRMSDKIKEIENFFSDRRSVLFITGGQGSGKTTLMNGVYASQKEKIIETVDRKGKIKLEETVDRKGKQILLDQVEQGKYLGRKDFDHCCWVDIAETAGLASFLKTVLKESNVDCDSIHEFELINMVHASFKDKYCLIVLDNVRDTSVLYSLKTILGGLEWKIICLTRRDIVQKDDNQDVVRIPGLEPYDSFKLFLSAAFRNFDCTSLVTRENFSPAVIDVVLHEAITYKNSCAPGSLLATGLVPMANLLKEVFIRCQNNPWNLWNIGTLLGANPLGKWKEIKERIDGMLITSSTEIYENCDPPVLIEDAELADATSRHCFLYCLAFPETHENSGGIPTRKLLRLWAAEGYMQDSRWLSQEQAADYLLEELIKKNLLVVKKKGFDGEVLKCSVNKHIRPLVEKMCEHQKFCKVVVDDAGDASFRSRTTKCFPIYPNIVARGKKTLSERYRVLAVHGDRVVKEALSKTLGKDVRLRSLLYFNTGRVGHSDQLDLSFRPKYVLLRTLDLQGARLAKLPYNIGCLVCLRYLGLRNTQLEDLPPTLERLVQLICLDIRDTYISEVADVSRFQEMRHLYLTNSFRDHSVAVREGLHSLVNLQTLSGAAYGDSSENMSFEEQISQLAGCLRKLSMKKTSAASSKHICDAIKGMQHLQSLAISCDKDGQEFDLHHLEVGNNLRKLKLGGPMGNFCDLGDKMHAITFLYLWNSRLSIDPLHALQGLMNLLVLSLLNVTTSEKMICHDDCYKKLKRLSIISMENLGDFTIGQNAMRNLEELVFAKCGNLKRLPDGLDQLGSLREVLLTEMLPQFCDEAKVKLNGKVHVLPDEISHVVPSRAATQGGN